MPLPSAVWFVQPPPPFHYSPPLCAPPFYPPSLQACRAGAGGHGPSTSLSADRSRRHCWPGQPPLHSPGGPWRRHTGVLRTGKPSQGWPTATTGCSAAAASACWQALLLPPILLIFPSSLHPCSPHPPLFPPPCLPECMAPPLCPLHICLLPFLLFSPTRAAPLCLCFSSCLTALPPHVFCSSCLAPLSTQRSAPSGCCSFHLTTSCGLPHQARLYHPTHSSHFTAAVTCPIRLGSLIPPSQ